MKKTLLLAVVLSSMAFGRVFEGNAPGAHGPLKIAVTMDGEVISKIEALESVDTKGIFNRAMNGLNSALNGKTSTEGVDVVAGSTVSSNGILEAVNDALTKK